MLTPIVVNDLSDPDDPFSGTGITLRKAILFAESSIDTNITIAFGVNGTVAINQKLGSFVFNQPGKNLTIDGGGHAVTINSTGGTAFFINGTTSTISSLELDRITITGSINSHLVFNSSATTSLTFIQDTFTGSTGGAVYSDGNILSELSTYSNNTITNGFTNLPSNGNQPSYAKGGGAAIQSSAQVESRLDTFTNNQVLSTNVPADFFKPSNIASAGDFFGGGAIAIFQNNTATNIVTPSLITVRDNFTNNEAWQGGAVYVAQGSYASARDTFTNNTAKYCDGGAIAFGTAPSAADNLSTKSDTFTGNTAINDYQFASAIGSFPGLFEHAFGYGGAIYAYNSWRSQFDVFSKNMAVFGGAAYLTGTNAKNYIYAGNFDSNSATYTPANKTNSNANPSTGLGGGAIMIEPDAINDPNASLVTTLDHDFFGHNTAYDGGAVANSHNVDASQLARDHSAVRNFDGIDANQIPISIGTSQLISDASTYVANAAVDRGGALFNDSNNALATVNDTFNGNSSSFQGGGLFNFGNLSMTNDTLAFNSATVTGGGLLAYQVGIPNRVQSTNVIRNSIIAGNTISNPNAGWVDIDGFLQTAQFNLLGVAGNTGIIDRANDQLGTSPLETPQSPVYLNSAQHGNLLLQTDLTKHNIAANDLGRVFTLDNSNAPIMRLNFALVTGIPTSSFVLATNSLANQLGGALAHLTEKLAAPTTNDPATTARVDDISSIEASYTSTAFSNSPFNESALNDPTQFFQSGFGYGLHLRIGDEIVRVIGIKADPVKGDYILTIDRGVNNSTAVAHDLNQALNLAYDAKNYTRTVNDAGSYQQQIGRTYIVNSTADINAGDNSLDFGDSSFGRLTLRQAIAYANSDNLTQRSLQTLTNGDLSQNGDTIRFDASLAGQTIDISKNELQLTGTQNILGKIVDANGKTLKPVTIKSDNSRVFEVGTQLTVSAGSVSINTKSGIATQTLTTNGSSGAFTLTLNGQTTPPISATVTSAQLQTILLRIAGISNVTVSVVITNTLRTFTITYPSSFAGTNQQGLTAAVVSTNAWVSDLVITGGNATPGALYSAADSANVTNAGGQIRVDNTGSLSLFRSLLQQNAGGARGGAVANFGTYLSEGNTYNGLNATQSGGAIYSNGVARSINDTIFKNSAARGGGIESDINGQLSLLNTTVVNNTVTTANVGAGIDLNTVNLSIVNAQAGTGRSPASQTLTILGSPANGASYTLSFNGQTTVAIRADAAALTIENALNQLNSIKAAGRVKVVTTAGTNVFTINFLLNGVQPLIGQGAIAADIRNSILLGNVSSNGTSFDVAGSLATAATNPLNATTNNVYGTADSAATIALSAAGTNNKLSTVTSVFGTANPTLDTNNGGPTPTLDLVNTSPALNAGSNKITTLAGSLLGLDTANTISVADLTFLGAGPKSGYDATQRAVVYPGQYIRIDNEILLITGINSVGGQQTLDVQRAQLGTLLAAHASGATISLATDQRGVIRGVNDAGAFSYNLARTIIVDNAGDFVGADGSPGKMTLRAAINQANIDNSGDVIKFSSAVFGAGKANSISLSVDTVQLNITGSENIVAVDETGAAIAGLTVGTSKLSRIFNLTGAATLGRTAPVVSISGLTIQGGTNTAATSGDGLGAAIFEDAEYNLTLTNDVFKSNVADTGGAIYAKGLLTTSLSTFDSNRAALGAGGAIYATNAFNSFADSFTNNQATAGAGGALNLASGFTLNSDTFSTNSATSGGAINFVGGVGYIVRSTLNSNSATNGTGGAIENAAAAGSLTLTNTTLALNKATGSGGAIHDAAQATLITINDTVAGNLSTGGTGGGVFAGGTEVLLNDIVVGNSAPFAGDADVSGFVEFATSNVLGAASSSGIAAGGSANNLLNQTLGSVLKTQGVLPLLAANGGATQTIALAANSPALGHSQSIAVITTPLLANQLTATVSTPLLFNIGEYYLIDQEVVQVVAISSTTVTLLRGQFNTGITDHPAQRFFNLYDSANGEARPIGDAGAFQAVATLQNNFSRSFIVDENSDLVDGNYAPGHLSLREAVQLAHGDTGNDLIVFASTLANQTIRLTNGELRLSKSLTIDGTNAANLTILQSTNDNHSRLFDLTGGASANQVVIKNLTLSGGLTHTGGGAATDGLGGAIYVASNFQLALSNASLMGNTADAGGAIYSLGAVTSANVSFTNNRATAGQGGAIQTSAALSSSQDTYANNQASADGGAIATTNTLTLFGDTFNTNQATSGNGGALFGNFAASSFTSQTDTFTGNSAANGGAIALASGAWSSTRDTFNTNHASASGGGVQLVAGTANLQAASFSKNTAVTAGGGLELGAAASATLVNESITGNQAGRGGGVDNAGTLNLGPGTISANSATVGNGGGIFTSWILRSTTESIDGNKAGASGGGVFVAGGSATLSADAIINNQAAVDGAGIAVAANAALNAVNSTIANNVATGNGGGLSITANGTLTGTNLTIAGNTAANGGGFNSASGSIENLRNTIIAGNKATAALNDVSGALSNATFTLIGDSASAGGLTEGVRNNLVGRTTAAIFKVDGNGNPLLATNAGGSTSSIQLAKNSPASGVGGTLAKTTSALTADTSSTTLTVDDITFITLGTQLRIDDESVLVTAIDSATKTITVVRAQAGTNLSAHATATPAALALDQANQLRANLDLGALLQSDGSNINRSQTIVVDATADTNDTVLTIGHISLRDAINQANKDFLANPAVIDTIKFSTSLAGKTITLNGSEIAIKGSLVIDAAGVTGITVNAGGLSRIFNIDDGDATKNSTVTIKNLTLSGGKTSLSGGAIFNAESLTLTNDSFSNNQAANGGAIFTKGSMTSSNDVFNNNSATILGGAIDFVGAGHTSSKDSFTGNTAPNGGALYVTAGAQVVLTTDLLTTNAATNNGGAILNYGDLTLTGGSQVTNNTAASGGGILSNFNLTSDHSVMSGNKASATGGGVLNAGTFTSNSDKISDNAAQTSGGGVLNQGTMTALNDTISGNHLDGGLSGIAATNGGGIFNSGTLNLGKAANGNAAAINGLNTLSGNAASNGAGIYNQNRLFSLGNSFQSNFATPASPTGSATGGALYNSGSANSSGDSFANNTSANQGGGLYNSGSFVGVNDAFTGNQAVNVNASVVTQGGASYNSGTLNLTNAQLTSNTATQGGGVFNASQFNSTNNKVLNNTATQSGGGLYNVGTAVSTTDTFTGNTAGLSGGAIYNVSNFTGQADLLTNNTANGSAAQGVGGGAIFNQGTVKLAASEVDNNTASTGGAVLSTSQFNSSGNTFARNRATTANGGGVSNSGSLVAVNDTYFANQAAASGGGLANTGSLTASNLTITGNQAATGGGVNASGTEKVMNTIIAGNTATASVRGIASMDFVGNLETAKNDLVGTTAGGTGITNGVNGNITGKTVAQIFVLDNNGKPLLANNGGRVLTVALASNSAAIDAGDNMQIVVDPITGQSVVIDATGKPRVVKKVKSIATVDIGAVEAQ